MIFMIVFMLLVSAVIFGNFFFGHLRNKSAKEMERLYTETKSSTYESFPEPHVAHYSISDSSPFISSPRKRVTTRTVEYVPAPVYNTYVEPSYNPLEDVAYIAARAIEASSYDEPVETTTYVTETVIYESPSVSDSSNKSDWSGDGGSFGGGGSSSSWSSSDNDSSYSSSSSSDSWSDSGSSSSDSYSDSSSGGSDW
jgi:hypothetical protein